MIQKFLFCFFMGSIVAMAKCPESGTFSAIEEEYKDNANQVQKKIVIYLCHTPISINTNIVLEDSHKCLPPAVLIEYLNTTVLDDKKKMAPGKYKSINRALKTLGFENGMADFDTKKPDSKFSQYIKDYPNDYLCLTGELNGKTPAQIEEIKSDAEYLAEDMNRFFKFGTEDLTGLGYSRNKNSSPSEQK